MADKVDYAIQDCEQLEVTVGSNLAGMKQKGFTDARKDELTSAKESVILKNAAQKKAIKLVETKTAEQNASMEMISVVVQKVRNGAKAAFDSNDPKLKLFKIGEQMPTSVKKMRSLCDYLSPVVLEYTDILLQNGLDQADIDLFHSAFGNLVAVDASQENAKKLQKAATISLNQEYANLVKAMSKVRAFAKTCFAGKPEILVQFKPILKGHGGGGEDENPPVEQPENK